MPNLRNGSKGGFEFRHSRLRVRILLLSSRAPLIKLIWPDFHLQPCRIIRASANSGTCIWTHEYQCRMILLDDLVLVVGSSTNADTISCMHYQTIMKTLILI